MNNNIFGVYIRVSTDMQADFGDSIEMQKNLAKNLIENNNGVLYKFYIEDGVSASKTALKDRAKLMECLNDVENGLINNLIAYRRDRLARRTEDSLAIRKILKDNNCKMMFTATGEQEMDLEDPYSKLMENVRSSLDEIESAQTAVRVSDTMFDKAKRGEFSGGNTPYGYENNNGYLVPIESQIPIIKEIVDMYLEGYGKYSIVKWLEGENVRNKGKRYTRATRIKQHKRSSTKWTDDIVDTILFNPTYSGLMQYTKRLNDINEVVVVESPYITPIRDKETQSKINNEREKRAKKINPPRRYSTSFLLTGIITCSECGREYASRTVTKTNGKRYSYYICKGRHSHNSVICKSKAFKKEILEQFVLEESKRYVRQFVDSNLYVKVKDEINKKDKDLSKKLEEVSINLNKKQNDFQSLSRLLLDLDTEDDMYEMMKDMYQSQQKEILTQLNSLKESKIKIEDELKIQEAEDINLDDIIEKLKDFNDIVEFAPFHLQKQLLENLFSKIEVDKKGNVTFFLAFEVDKKSSTIGFMSIGDTRVAEDKNSVMFNGGVGDTTTLNNITFMLNEKTHSSNFFKWLFTLVDYISESFYPFVISKNDKMTSPRYFAQETGLSRFMHKEYRLYKRLPSYNNCERILKAANSNIEEFLNFIKNKITILNQEILEQILNNNITIKRSMKRMHTTYKTN